MDAKLNMPDTPPQEAETKPIEYNVDKMVFVVTPVHREESDRTVHDVLLNLMKRDAVAR